MSKRKAEDKDKAPRRARRAEAAPAPAAPPIDDADDEDDAGPDGVALDADSGALKPTPYRNKQRCLVLASRGITVRHRHLLEDLRNLLPHHKKDVKLDAKKSDLRVINELCEIKSCNGALYLEARKHRDLYLWLARAPHGPSAKFLVHNVHTMDELKLTGNCARGTRPLLAFDAGFESAAPGGGGGSDNAPHWRLLRALLTATFGTPRGHPNSKPFFDHVLAFSRADGRVWVRHYQIAETDDGARRADIQAAAARGGDLTSLVEIGPRLVLQPIRVFAGAFGGATLYANSAFVTPNAQRAAEKAQSGSRYADRKNAKEAREEHVAANTLPRDPVADVFRGALRS